MNQINSIIKRDGRRADFNIEKIDFIKENLRIKPELKDIYEILVMH
mgnify:CR=1 FL=1